MPRYLISLEAYIDALDHVEAEQLWHTGEYKSYVCKVEQVESDRSWNTPSKGRADA
jgi:hypothetical protein